MMSKFDRSDAKLQAGNAHAYPHARALCEWPVTRIIDANETCTDADLSSGHLDWLFWIPS